MTEWSGHGPWARLFATAVVPDEGSALAERARSLVGDVEELEVVSGRITALVGDCRVAITSAPVSPRIWTAVTRFTHGNRPLEAGIAGREQSVHLEHLLTVDWEAPLVPRRVAIGRSCSCDADGACVHVAAVAFAFAVEIDRDPGLLLRWRGCGAVEPEPEPVPVEPPPAGDVWLAGPLPEPRPLRPLPPAAVLKRLGPSGIRAGGSELETVLERAYAAFARGSET